MTASEALARLRELDRGDFQSIIWFGSAVRRTEDQDSDIDLMILVDPLSSSWSPGDNIQERQRLDAAFLGARPRLDLWVRTVDQYEEAKRCCRWVGKRSS